MLPLWTPAYVAIGSNLGDPLKNVRDSFAQLAAIRSSRLIARSRFYLTAPLGPQDQPHFVNAAAGLLTLKRIASRPSVIASRLAMIIVVPARSASSLTAFGTSGDRH